MTIKGIYTIRDTPQPHYWDIVFEWEDEFSKKLGAPLIHVGKKYDSIYKPSVFRKILNRLNFYQWADRLLFKPKDYFLAFHIGPPGVYSFHSRLNVIPVILDFWKNENLVRFETIFKYSLVVFVTSREVFDFIKTSGVKLRIEHLPLSLPDSCLVINPKTPRDIDIIQFGRSNATFNEYMERMLLEQPDIHYVTAKKKGASLEIISTRVGSMGVMKEREQFTTLMKRSRISLVSAPGMDDDRDRTGGFSPVTPRFLESAAFGCKLIGIYPHNADFGYFRIDEICPAVSSYDEFKKVVQQYLADDKLRDVSEFLRRHLSSVRALELMQKLKAYA